MTGKRWLSVENVWHEAFVALDEKGTEAAATTTVVNRLTAAPAQPKQVRVDRPFIFMIRDVQTATVLFLGRVANPVA